LRIYFDPSFLSSLYAPDSNSAAALAAVPTSSAVKLVTHLTELEFRNALQLRVFRKEQTLESATATQSMWQKNLEDGHFALCPLPEGWTRRSHIIAQQATARLGIRALDLIHVAAAVELEADALFSFDERQRRLARELKLKVN
jgi:predicted nucleic acid-binding protein